MKRYAVAICPHDEDNRVVLVEAKNEIEAMAKAVGEEELWRIDTNELPFSTVDEAITFYLQGEISVSPPVEI